MPITEIALENFKAFKDEQRIPLGSRLTLIYGRNSAGKSSILHALLALRQSWTHEGALNVLNTNGALVHLGRFGNVVHGQEDRVVSIGIAGRRAATPGAEPEDFGITRFRYGGQFVPPELPWMGSLEEVAIGERGDLWRLTPSQSADDREPEVLRLVVSPSFWRGITVPDGDTARVAQLLRQSERVACGVLRVGPRLVKATLESPGAEGFENASTIERHEFIASREHAERVLAGPLEHAFNHHVLGVRDLLLSLRPIAQTRASGRRIYEIQPDRDRAHVGRHGGHVAEMLFENAELLSTTNELLADLGLDLQIQFNPDMQSTGTVLEMILRAAGSNLRLSLPDVGSGVSQLLPIIVQYAHELLLARSGAQPGVIWVEQPELHLHTELQMFVPALLVWRATPTHPQVIFETHSEIVVTAVRQMVHDGLLDAREVKVLWVKRQEDGTGSVVDLRLNESGGFGTPWPEGYFGERLAITRGRIRWPIGT